MQPSPRPPGGGAAQASQGFGAEGQGSAPAAQQESSDDTGGLVDIIQRVFGVICALLLFGSAVLGYLQAPSGKEALALMVSSGAGLCGLIALALSILSPGDRTRMVGFGFTTLLTLGLFAMAVVTIEFSLAFLVLFAAALVAAIAAGFPFVARAFSS
jgi:hypothetical protein